MDMLAFFTGTATAGDVRLFEITCTLVEVLPARPNGATPLN
jgi:hypothetical protein